ncbi:hypothetical protein DVH24_024475 [Malus domestica]|uniref:Uncharacterized protein n=1 Tax=Malus domestica TaxID=3750 RepID=A0A498JN85_MALDO|nr:hypothetical protein DVH24_024475 [Malus domestica]
MLTWLNRDHKNRRARGGYQNWRAENPITPKSNSRSYDSEFLASLFFHALRTQGQRGRGRPRKTWKLDYLDLTKDITQNQAQWRSRIHIADSTQ